MEGKVAILGSSDFVMPFAALGLDTFAVVETDEIAESAKKIISGHYTVVVVSEDIAEIAEDYFSPQLNSPTPCIVAVPFTTESTGAATKSLGEVLKMATGIDILQSQAD